MAMAIAEDMKRLTDDMIAANDMRLRAVGALVTGTRETLQGFCAGRHKMAADQAKDLASFLDELSKTVRELRHRAQGMVKEFDKANRHMSKEQSQHLADFVQDLAQDVTSMLHRFDKERGRVSKELRDRLAQEITEIKAAVEQILKDTGSFREEQHGGMVKARQAWRAMSVAIGRARKAGLMTSAVEAGHKTSAAKQASRRRRGTKNAAMKNT